MSISQSDAPKGTSIASTETDRGEGATEVDLVALLYCLVDKLKYIAAAAILGALIAAVWTFQFVTPMYSATSKLYVLNSKDSVLNLSDLQIGTYLASDYQEVFKNWHVHEMVLQRLDLKYSYKELSSMLTVTNPSNTRVLYITVASSDPKESKAIADTYAKVAQEFIVAKMDVKEPSLFEEALLPSMPSSPNKTRNIMLGFILGLFVSCGIIVVRFVMDDRIRTAEDIEKYIDIPILGLMPAEKKTAVNRHNGKGKRRA